MSTPRERLRQARRNAGFKSPSEAARFYPELNPNTLISNENGNREISKEMAVKYGIAFGVDPGWILFGVEPVVEKTDQSVPLLSLVSAGKLVDQVTISESEMLRRVTVGELPPGDWVAFRVQGDSMDRVAPDGSIIVVDRADLRLVDGRFYVFVLDNGEATFKRYRQNPQRLQPYSTNPDHLSIPANRDDMRAFGRVRRVISDL